MRGRREEELLDAGFAVGQAVAEKRKVGVEPGIRRDREVRVGLEGVVHGHAHPRAERAVGIHDRIAAAVGEHRIVLGDQLQKRIIGVRLHAIERGRRIDVPEHDERLRPPHLQDERLEQLVEDTRRRWP